ncbi:MAG: hypothetical protein AB7N70_07850 [Dehalococcoidia bacterium]
MAELMEKYQDRPMDLADASLVAAAERLEQRRIFTLDDDFHITSTDKWAYGPGGISWMRE